MLAELEKELSKLTGEELAVIMPSWYFEAVDMCQNEPELYEGETPQKVALNAFFDNLQDSPKTDALEMLAALILNLMGAVE